jgi:multiple sugar transport system substrate-binding protein
MSNKTTEDEFLDEWASAIEEAQKKYDENFKK